MGNSQCFSGVTKIAASATSEARQECVGSKVFFHNGISWSLGVVEEVESLDRVRVKRLSTEKGKAVMLSSADIFRVDNGESEYFCLSEDDQGVSAPDYEALDVSCSMEQVAFLQVTGLGMLIRGLPMFCVDDGRPCKISAIGSADKIEVTLLDGSRQMVKSSQLSRTPVAIKNTNTDSMSRPVRGNSEWSISTRGTKASHRSERSETAESDLWEEMFEVVDETPVALQKSVRADPPPVMTKRSSNAGRFTWPFENAGLQNAKTFLEEDDHDLLLVEAIR